MMTSKESEEVCSRSVQQLARNPIFMNPILNEDSSMVGGSTISRRNLEYFSVNVSELKDEFLLYHGLLPQLHLRRCAVQKQMMERSFYKTGSPPISACRPIEHGVLPATDIEGAVALVSAESTQKIEEVGNSDLQRSDESRRDTSCNSEEDEKGATAFAITSIPRFSVKEESNDTNELSVEACLLRVTPDISENIVCAVCTQCNTSTRYSQMKCITLFEDTMWPDNRVPTCPSKLCCGRLLYWGIFRAKLFLRTRGGEYLTAQANSPNAEYFFGCSARDFMKNSALRTLIKDRVSELIVNCTNSQKHIFKRYNAVMFNIGGCPSIKIDRTSLFDP